MTGRVAGCRSAECDGEGEDAHEVNAFDVEASGGEADDGGGGEDAEAGDAGEQQAGGDEGGEREGDDARLVGGSAVFGVGWGIAGFCPGAAVPALGSGKWEVALFVAALLAGLWVARMVRDRQTGKRALA